MVSQGLFVPFLRFGRGILFKRLAANEKDSIEMPSNEEIASYQKSIGQKYSMLQDVFCVADVLELTLEQSGKFVIQKLLYFGWTHDHYVGNVFVFAPSGLIIACALNAPGSMHDSVIADWSGIYMKLETV